MYKPVFQKHNPLVFRQFQRKGYSLFACLGREVVISVLSIATLSSARAEDLGNEAVETDSVSQVNREVKLSGIDVTGSRAPLGVGQATRMVTVLSREDIQAAPVQSINDLLKMAVGVDVRQRGPIGAQTDVSIRGGTHEQIAILLNGINICDPQTGHNTLDLPVDLSEIERIEVLEGPAGRVYGTSSLVGAINIVTKGRNGVLDVTNDALGKKNGTAIDLHAEGGSYGYLSAGGRYEFNAPTLSPKTQSKAFFHSLSAGYTRSDGHVRSKAGHLNSDYKGVKLFGQGGYEDAFFSMRWHAGLTSKGFGSNTFYSAKFDEQYEQTTKLFTALQGESKKGFVRLRPVVYWNRSYDRFELIRGNDEQVPFNRHRTDVFGMNLNSHFDWFLGRTAIGAEFRNEDIVSTNLGEPLNTPHAHYKYGLNRSNLNFHVEHNVLLRRLTCSAGFVAVKNTWNQMPFTLYPGIDASLRITDKWRLYASYNSSLRMPSFTELYYSVGGHKADKYLKPEEMRAVEAGMKYQARQLTASASIFHHYSRNLIDWVMDTNDPEAVWQSVNHTKVNTLGFETSARLSLSHLTASLSPLDSYLSLSYCYLNQNKDLQPLLQSQYSLEYLRHKLTASLQLPITNHLGFLLNYRFQDRTGSYTDTYGSIKDYTPYSILDGRLSWATDTYTVYVEGSNLTNSLYVDYGNVPQPGTWLIVGARLHLQL